MLFANLANIYRSVLFRGTCLFIVVFLSATLIILAQTDEAIEKYFEDETLKFGNDLLSEKLAFFEEFGIQALVQEISTLSIQNPKSREIYVLLDENCNPIAGAPERLHRRFMNVDMCENLMSAGGNRVFDLARSVSGIQYHSAYNNSDFLVDDAVAILQALPSGGWLLLVMVAPEAAEARDFMDSTLAWTFALLFLGGLTAAIFLSLSVSRRLEKVNLMSQEIRVGDLSRRIPLNGSSDEFENLSINLNKMLDRIEQVLEGSKQVTNDIAHDLRTPLTRIQTRIESLKTRSENDNTTLEALTKISDDATALLDMFNSLLRIAGVESGRITSSFTQVNYSQVCNDAIELLDPIADEKSISLMKGIENSIYIQGDRNLLFHATMNIIENAIKYTSAGGSVLIELSSIKNEIVFHVLDEGPGIPDAKMASVFKRFYRLEEHRGAEGHGLGLSLVKAVIDLHRGKIELESLDCGLNFVITFPNRS